MILFRSGIVRDNPQVLSRFLQFDVPNCNRNILDYRIGRVMICDEGVKCAAVRNSRPWWVTSDVKVKRNSFRIGDCFVSSCVVSDAF